MTWSSFTRRLAPATSGAGSPSARCGHARQPIDKESDTNFIKRIVAGPGDRLSIKGGHPVVNGKEAKEDFIKPCDGGNRCNQPKTITIRTGTTS